ncbi:MAG: carbamoyltransferase HypF [Rhodothermales bacterium]|nr:carbamoyltransferase HypF [Rhodothermales bacterium]
MEVIRDIHVRRRRLRVNGIVQGVGFRPFVFRLANHYDLSGFVNNDSRGVCIEIEGSSAAIAWFQQQLRVQAPPLSRIGEILDEDLVPIGETGFRIKSTERKTDTTTHIAPDGAVCDDCLSELFDPSDRRYLYPFINCTNCGPRYTIVRRIPYDRPNTSMDVFPLCEECEQEYRDPADRRFHAQPNACPVCGPRLALYDGGGEEIRGQDPVRSVAELLRRGNIVAIRGVGGFHLAADASNDHAVQRLRERKGRAEKPFAMMAPDVQAIRKHCAVDAMEESLLLHNSRPIVLLNRVDSCAISSSVAPQQRYLGFMLPYAPVHHLLLRNRFDALVMTSANHSEEPIAISNQEAIERLAGVADFFLTHDREILQRCDDSVVRVVRGKTRFHRRSRGQVPTSIELPGPCDSDILAVGGELKNTIALSRGRDVFLSQHVGDLDNPKAYTFFEDSIRHLASILEIKPNVIACDLHPEYLSTKWALTQDLPRLSVQHHHAHLASVMVENGVSSPTIGIILDGTGYGTDGTIWGGEVLVGDFSRFDRFAWLSPLPLPGGEVAIRQPWRLAIAALYLTFGKNGLEMPLPLLADLPPADVRLVATMIDRDVNSPACSSAGRLFDAVAALCNLRTTITYEAQAAIELEMTADGPPEDTYPFDAGAADGAIATRPLIAEIVADLTHGVSPSIVSSRFHSTLAQMFARTARAARDRTGINVVGLSGGVFQNVVLFNRLCERLLADGFDVLTHSRVPTNDGGLALGQAAIASKIMST